MYITGISSKTKDKRVDRILKNEGYEEYKIFYSPISVWIFMSLSTLLLAIPIIFEIIKWYYIFGCIFSGYFLSAFLNNSFAVSKEELIVINPNFPFKKIVKYNFKSIDKIIINKNRWMYLLLPFCIFGCNYVQIYLSKTSIKFYCNSLDVDTYDENLTELTLDNFADTLKDKNIKTEMLI